MTEPARVKRRRQFCARCGQLMFEYYCSRDGLFGMVDDLGGGATGRRQKFHCPTCGACYRLLDRLDAMEQPVVKL